MTIGDDGTDTHLDLGDRRLDTRSIVDVLRATPSLRSVDLRGAALDDLDTLVSAVEMHPSLTHLRVDGLSASQRTRVVIALTRNRNRLRVTVPARRTEVATATVAPPIVAPRPDAEALAQCAATLRAIESRTTGDGPDDLALREVRQLCARVTAALRERARNDQRQRRAARAARDRARLDDTGIRQGRLGIEAPGPPSTLEVGRNCYVCKARYRALDTFYDQLCPACADFNRARRTRSADLRGRVALVTGGRVKIGRCVVLKLLRAGARVIATTRFPHDAWRRYAAEPDFEAWRDRLEIHGLDLRFLSRVEGFARSLAQRLGRLDMLISNAAQTVARPPDWYAEMLRLDAESVAALPAGIALQPITAYAPSDGLSSGVALLDTTPAALDRHAQPIDLRAHNSWRALVGEVSTHELVSVHAVTTLAPFVLLNALRPLMARSPDVDRFVVLVSAVEGQFERRNKTPRHPHTNMAKAALNMLARTSASDLAFDRIWCCAVDTGWITDENPLPMADAMAARGFAPPLDEEDGAARVLDPVFRVHHGEAPAHGVFLKDYAVAPW